MPAFLFATSLLLLFIPPKAESSDLPLPFGNVRGESRCIPVFAGMTGESRSTYPRTQRTLAAVCPNRMRRSSSEMLLRPA